MGQVLLFYSCFDTHRMQLLMGSERVLCTSFFLLHSCWLHMASFHQGHDCVNLCRLMEQTNYFYLLISNVFKEHLGLWKMIIIKKWCLTTDSPQCYWWWLVQSAVMYDNLKRSVVDRAFGVLHIIAELLFVFLQIHNYHFLYHFNVTFLILISLHDPERHLLLAQVRGFFIVLIC